MRCITSLLAVTVSSLTAADFQFDYNAHLNMAFGQASVEESTLATHAHDPNDEFTLQGFEVNLSARYGDHIAGFVSYNTFLYAENKIDGEFEEAFLKLEDLPAGFELRGGRFLNRVTSQNNQHLHSWNFVDANLITTRFLGDEGLISNSAEVSYRLPFEHDSLLSLAFGDAIAHDEHHAEHAGHDDRLLVGARWCGVHHAADRTGGAGEDRLRDLVQPRDIDDAGEHHDVFCPDVMRRIPAR